MCVCNMQHASRCVIAGAAGAAAAGAAAGAGAGAAAAAAATWRVLARTLSSS